MIEKFVRNILYKLVGNHVFSRKNHFVEIVVRIVGKPKFGVYEQSEFVRNRQKFLIGNGRMKPCKVKPVFFCLLHIFAIKPPFTELAIIRMFVSFRSPYISSDVKRNAV